VFSFCISNDNRGHSKLIFVFVNKNILMHKAQYDFNNKGKTKAKLQSNGPFK